MPVQGLKICSSASASGKSAWISASILCIWLCQGGFSASMVVLVQRFDLGRIVHGDSTCESLTGFTVAAGQFMINLRIAEQAVPFEAAIAEQGIFLAVFCFHKCGKFGRIPNFVKTTFRGGVNAFYAFMQITQCLFFFHGGQYFQGFGKCINVCL